MKTNQRLGLRRPWQGRVRHHRMKTRTLLLLVLLLAVRLLLWVRLCRTLRRPVGQRFLLRTLQTPLRIRSRALQSQSQSQLEHQSPRTLYPLPGSGQTLSPPWLYPPLW